VTLTVDLAATFSADGADDFHIAADFAVEDGETVVVLGPSGSGKTLLLETIAGFHDHAGTVRRNGRDLSDEPPESRHFGFVFQDYALFPHMTVLENVGFGTRVRGRGAGRLGTLAALGLGPDDDADAESRRELLAGVVAARRQRVRATGRRLRNRLGGGSRPTPEPEGLRLLRELGVAGLAERYPPTLSGGEQQRVALARALTVGPRVMLLDEPLSSLDVPTRQSLRADLQDVLADVTAVYVTHNRTTARALADRIVVMNDGEIVQTGTPEDVFERPASPLVARFTGSNVVPLSVLPALAERLDGSGDGDHLAIRPETVVLGGGGGGADATATVERVTREDATTRVACALATGDGAAVTVDAYSDDPPAVGETVSLRFPRDALTPC
jgi:ABC-type Fe3+/spermidine/putrescine transport system ATPase subunit